MIFYLICVVFFSLCCGLWYPSISQGLPEEMIHQNGQVKHEDVAEFGFQEVVMKDEVKTEDGPYAETEVSLCTIGG